MRADLLVLGTGVVGGALLDLLASDRAPRGLHVFGAFNTRTPPLDDAALDALAVSSLCPVLVDATPADGIESLYARALSRGIHVVTANKKPLAAPWRVRQQLFALAEDRGVSIGREATVGAGLPIVGTLGDLVATGDRVRRVDCVLSGTLAFLCDELHAGTPLSRAIAVAKERGYTEPDPREDLGGADVARKAVILAREMGFPLELGDVDLVPFASREEPIDDGAWARRVAEAESRGERLVYLARIEVDRDTARATARLESLPRTHPAAASRGPVALASFTTDRYAAEPLVVRGPGAGGPVTASALVADVLRLRARTPSSTLHERRAGTPLAGIEGGMRNAIRIGRLFGIELRVDSSWLLIFTLVIWSLTSLFGGWHPDWSIPTRTAVAVVAALAFFASVLFHEMAHSLVARMYGIPVRDITLHMFGGVSNIEKEPPTPGAEFLMAIVGPLASVGLGVSLMVGGAMIANLGAPDVETPADLVARMGPITTLVMWLGPVNVMVGLFNLIPGFPLDGGRVLRAILWKATGSLRSATRWSTAIGQMVGWALIATGALMAIGVTIPFFGRGIGGGIWLALIGFFLRNAAVQQQNGAALAEELGDARVADLMRTGGPWTDASVPLDTLIHRFAVGEERAMPVFDGGRFAGIVSITDVRRAGSSPYVTARDVMTPLERLTVTTPDTPVVDALRAFGSAGASELPVVVDGALVGMLFDRDIARWLEVRGATKGRRPPLQSRESHA